MKTTTKLSFLMALVVTAITSSAQVFQGPNGFVFDGTTIPQTLPVIIPDNDFTGIQDTRTISGLPTSFTGGMIVQALINIDSYPVFTGGLTGTPILDPTDPTGTRQLVSNPNNGDYYATLTHNGTRAVLLNRVGRDAANPGGYGDIGMHVILSDNIAPGTTAAAPANDIHVYRTFPAYQGPGQPLGSASSPQVWAPDGRSRDSALGNPQLVTTSSPRDLTLSVFNNVNPNGDWTLFIADLNSGGQGVLTSWGLNFVQVPEPHQYAMIAGLALIGFALYRRFALKAA